MRDNMDVLTQDLQAQPSDYSALSVCGFEEGVVQAIPVEGNLTAPIITNIIENHILPLLLHNVFLVVDNASVQDEVAICRILSRKNITLLTVTI